jgi:hypothetical protein
VIYSQAVFEGVAYFSDPFFVSGCAYMQAKSAGDTKHQKLFDPFCLHSSD